MAETTNSLLKNIVNGKDFPKILETNKDAFEELAVSEYLRRLCEERDIVPEQVIKKAQIDRTYGHQIFNGTQVPSRDKLIQIAFGFGLTLEETQNLPKSAGKSGLLYHTGMLFCLFVIADAHKDQLSLIILQAVRVIFLPDLCQCAIWRIITF